MANRRLRLTAPPILGAGIAVDKLPIVKVLIADVKAAAPAGYSGTPLAKKLGIKEGSRVVLVGAPDDYERLVAPVPKGVVFERRAGSDTDIAHVFVTKKDLLAGHLRALRKTLGPGAAVWVSWPKKSAGVPTTVTEDVIRELALPLGFVDVKVCAVTDVWSGLKLVVRKALR